MMYVRLLVTCQFCRHIRDSHHLVSVCDGFWISYAQYLVACSTEWTLLEGEYLLSQRYGIPAKGRFCPLPMISCTRTAPLTFLAIVRQDQVLRLYECLQHVSQLHLQCLPYSRLGYRACTVSLLECSIALWFHHW